HHHEGELERADDRLRPAERVDHVEHRADDGLQVAHQLDPRGREVERVDGQLAEVGADLLPRLAPLGKLVLRFGRVERLVEPAEVVGQPADRPHERVDRRLRRRERRAEPGGDPREERLDAHAEDDHPDHEVFQAGVVGLVQV
ncbi:hypothetical protein BUZ91_13715, partial [Mammaliicoccus sciuri]